MKITFSASFTVERGQREAREDSSSEPPIVEEGNTAQVEQAPPHFPLGFTPNDVEARRRA